MFIHNALPQVEAALPRSSLMRVDRRQERNPLAVCSLFSIEETEKVRLVTVVVPPVVLYGCESWTVRRAECERTDAFELGFWTGESLGLHGDQTSQP